MRFTHIHTHSFSIRDSMLKIDDIIQFCIHHNEAVALTDHGSIAGWLHYYNAIQEANATISDDAKKLKPIFGVEIYINQFAKELMTVVKQLENKHLTPEERKALSQKRDELSKQKYHLVLLAKNTQGFYNIINLMNKAYINYFYSKPLLDYQTLFSVGKNSGIIVTTACLLSPLVHITHEQELIDFIAVMKEYFGDDFYLEVQCNNIKEQREFNKKLITLSQKTNTKLVIGNDAHYLLKEDAEIHQDLLLLQNKQTIDDLGKIDYKITYENKKGEIKTKKIAHDGEFGGHKVTELKKGQMVNNYTIIDIIETPRVFTYNTNLLYLKTEKQIRKEIEKYHLELLPYVDTIIASNYEIYNKIEYIHINTDLKLPHIDNAEKILTDLVKQKLKILQLVDKKYIERAKYELQIIKRFKFETYFLILYDLIKWARENNIGIGAGRGSSAGSFIAYLLDIHRINPFDPRWDVDGNGLPFERFLDLQKLFAKVIITTQNKKIEVLEDKMFTVLRNNVVITVPAIELQCNDIFADTNDIITNIVIKHPPKTYPDIDMDFSPDGRQKIIDYLVQKYGEQQVALVGTHLVYSSKSILRDLGQVYNIPPSETQKCTKEYNDTLTVEENIVNNNKIKEFFNKYPQLRNKVDKLSGVISAIGIHAGGVVITDKQYPIYQYCALQRSKDNSRIATLWTKEYLQQIGIIKYDILGLTTAGQNHLIKQMIGLNPYEDFSVDDIEVYKDIVLNCKNKNIFQFETQLGKQAFKDLQPMSFMELANASGIIRLLGSDEGRDVYMTYARYVERLHNNDTEYWKQQLRKEIYEDRIYNICVDVLKESYGVLIYQEQLANLVKYISNGEKTFTDGNQLRKALETFGEKYGKLAKRQGNAAALKEWHSKFLEILNIYILPYLNEDGYNTKNKELHNFLYFKLTRDNILPTPKTGIIKWLLTAANYLFNKLHAIAYTVNTYNAMYLKHYYPLQFWCGSLIYEYNDLDKIKAYISAIQSETNIRVLPPNINKSDFYFSIENDSIRYGLGSILNIGNAAYSIVQERLENGEFKSIDDLFRRVNKKYLNKRIIEALLYTNALSDFGTIENVYTKLLKYVQLSPLPKPLTDRTLSLLETKLIGVSLSFTHPIIQQARGYLPITLLQNNTKDYVAVQILDIKKKTTKTNKPYTIFKCKCLNSNEVFNVFDWSNNSSEFNKNTIEIFYIYNNNNFYQLHMDLNIVKNKKIKLLADTLQKIKLNSTV